MATTNLLQIAQCQLTMMQMVWYLFWLHICNLFIFAVSHQFTDLVFDVLPSQRPQDVCDFQTLVTLDENLECHGRECLVDTLRVVEVFPGTFYEYIQTPCVYFPFYSSEHSAKVFANWDNSITMCADKRAASALSSCCGGYSEQNPSINRYVFST
jgi:hypothetical protein